MKDLVKEGICMTQGDIYEMAARKKYDMKQFSDIYMKSDFCNREMDAVDSRFHVEHPRRCLSELFRRSPEPDQGNTEPFPEDEAYWIGDMYRRIAIDKKIKSRELVDLIPFSMMRAAYPGMHTISDEDAVERLTKNLKI